MSFVFSVFEPLRAAPCMCIIQIYSQKTTLLMIKIPFLITLFTKNPFSPAKHPVDTPDLPCIRRSGEPSLWYSLLQSGPEPNLSLPTHAKRFRVSLSPAVPVARFAVPVVMGATEQDLCWLDFTFPQLSFRRQLAMISEFRSKFIPPDDGDRKM